MDFMRAFSKNLFNLFDITAFAFVIKFSRSLSQIWEFMIMIVVISAGLHLYNAARSKRDQRQEQATA